MLFGKLSSKSQITIPKKVRQAAGLHPGDVVACEVRETGIIELRRLEPFDAAFHKALSKTLDEWESPEDKAAFRDL